MADTINTSNIEAILLNMSSKLDKMSQAMFRMAEDNAEHSNTYIRDNTRVRRARSRRNDYVDFEDHSRNPALQIGKRITSAVGDFMDEFEYQLTDALVVSKFKDSIGSSLKSLADQLGVEIGDLPKRFAQISAKDTATRFISNSRIGQKLSSAVQGFADNLSAEFKSTAKSNALAKVRSQYSAIRDRISQYGAAGAKDLDVLGITQAQYQQMTADEVNQLLSQRQMADIQTVTDLIEGKITTQSLAQTQQSSTTSAHEFEVARVNAAQHSAQLSTISDNVERIKDILEELSGPIDSPTEQIRQDIENDASDIHIFDGAQTQLSSEVDSVSEALGGLGQEFLTSASEAGMASAAASSLAEVFPPLKAATVLLKVANVALGKQIKEVTAGLKEMAGAVAKAADKDYESKNKIIELANKRRAADMETYIRKPFEILEKAAESIYQTWDANLRTISATQGYDKTGVQDLMSVFAQRIRAEGLTDVVSGTDIVNNLTKVLNAGLSGAVAEEFAYQASILNAAIPTQDFFSYASTYSSIAANAIRDGKSQSDAIAAANASLESFANNLLYASRELAGGFSTGLSNATSLYEQAVRITQAAKVGDTSEVAGVLTSVAATVGAIAPDLSNSITDAIYKAATGGNDATTVALRSLAGVNASNTEFLRALANDPQSVFANLFNNLAAMFTDSSDAYMEKAEGYAELFGLSAEAFQRIDFEYLAQAVQKMNTDSSALEDNLKLLASGQTTLSAEQQRNRQINEYMINEGLAYVLDNEAAREIQKHLWDEQLNQQLMENEYGVEFVGATKSGFQKIMNGISKIGKIISNPVTFIASRISNAKEAAEEVDYLESSIADMIRAGVVGSGAGANFANFTEYGQTLLRGDLADVTRGGEIMNEVGSNLAVAILHKASDVFNKSATSVKGPASAYNWGMASKSAARAASAYLLSSSGLTSTIGGAITSQAGVTTHTATSGVSAKIEQMLSDAYLSGYANAENPRSFEDWVASASSLGIADFDAALKEAGYNKADVESYFEDKQTTADVEAAAELRRLEKKFYEAAVLFYETTFPIDFKDPLFESIESMNNTIIAIRDILGTNGVNTVRGLIDITNTSLRIANERLDKIQTDTNILRALFSPGGQLFIVISTLTSIANDAAAMRSTMNTTIANKLTESTTSLSNMLSATNGISSKADSINTKLSKLDNINTTNSYILTSNGKLDTINTTLKSVLGSKLDSLSTSMTSVGTAVTYSGVKSSTSGLESYLRAFSRYFIDHNVYSNAYNEQKFQQVQEDILKDKDAQQGQAITALADALTSNAVDLKDPAVQTNALLSQILRTLNAILQAEANSEDNPLSLVGKLLGSGRK